MPKKVLITSFDVWEAHHRSNSSDDLLVEMLARQQFEASIHLLRKIPVTFVDAPEKVIAKIQTLQPDVIICCGMAETRSRLTIESNGKFGDEILETQMSLETLVEGLTVTSISDDAGTFVCNHLYYSLLKYIHDSRSRAKAIFVHVPVLTAMNLDAIADDFSQLLQRVS
jgi:pyroglutamyl-peptidase